MSWTEFALFLHILIAVVGFGPTFVFGVIGFKGGKEPAHVNFALRLSETIAKRLVIPLAVAMPLVGTWLVFLRGWDLWASEWLWISIILYVIVFSNAIFVLVPTGSKLVKMTEHMLAPPPGAAPGGPPPEVARLVRIQQIAGPINLLLLVTIILLMVTKPGGALTGS